MKWCQFFLISLSLYSCASLTKSGEKVRLTQHAEIIKNCKFIKQVKVSTALSGTGEIAAQDDLRVRIRNEAALNGGNVVLEQGQSQTFTGFELLGDTYDCPPEELSSR